MGFGKVTGEYGGSAMRLLNILKCLYRLPEIRETTKKHHERRCQRKSNRSAQPQNRWISSRKLTPLCQGSRAMVLEVIAAVEGTLLIEMIVD